MLPFGVTIPATVPQSLEIPEGLMNYPVYVFSSITETACIMCICTIYMKKGLQNPPTLTIGVQNNISTVQSCVSEPQCS